MGVEHYLVCHECKEYIDLHKSYEYSMVVLKDRPPVGLDCKQSGFNDVVLRGGYWESRGLWFLWRHRSHKNIELHTDCDDDWYDLKPHLQEVFPHEKDIEIRKKLEAQHD